MSAANVETLAVLGLLLGAGPPLLIAGVRWLSRFLEQAKTAPPLPASATPLPSRLEIAPLPRAAESPVPVSGSHFGPATAGVAHSSSLGHGASSLGHGTPALGHGQAASTAFSVRGAGSR